MATGTASIEFNQIVGDTGTASIEYDQRVVLAFGEASIEYNQIVSGTTGVAGIVYRQTVGETGTASVEYNQIVSPLTGTASIEFNQVVGSTGTASIEYDQRVVNISQLTASTVYWRPFIMLDGVDVSSSLIGTVRVEMEEGAARVCDFSIEPSVGVINITDWIGVSVAVDFVQQDISGDDIQAWRMFTGVVDLPEYDPVTGTVSFSCTDQLQDIFDNMDFTAIEEVVGGYWSSDVFNEDVTGWQYLQDRVSTVAGSVELNAQRMPLYTPWASGSSIVTFTESEIDDESIKLQLAQRRDLHNITNLTIDYRYERLYQRNRRVAWTYPRTFCEHVGDSASLPSSEMVTSAINGSGWLVDSLSFSPLRESGAVVCHNVFGAKPYDWINNTTLVTGFAAGLSKRWTQTITEQYQITMRADGSIDTHGELPKEATVSFQTEYDYTEWEERQEDAAGEGGSIATPVDHSNTSIPRNTMVGHLGGYDPEDTSEIDSEGDNVSDRSDRVQSDNTIETILSQNKVDMLSAHRQHHIDIDVELAPWLDLTMTARIETDRVTGQGKISHIVSEMNIDSGEATSSITVSISRGGGTDDSDLDVPPPPNYVPGELTGAGSQALTSHYGRIQGADEYSERWTGFIGNYVPGNPIYPTYPVELKFSLPEIEDDRRDAVELPREQLLYVQIQNDELTISF